MEIEFENGAHLKISAIFDILFTFLVTTKSSFSTYLTYTYFAQPIGNFAPPLPKFATKTKTNKNKQTNKKTKPKKKKIQHLWFSLV